MNYNRIKNILIGIAMILLVLGQFFIIIAPNQMFLGIVLNIICALLFALSFTGKFTVILDFFGRLFAPKPLHIPVVVKAGKTRKDEARIPDNLQDSHHNLPRTPSLNLSGWLQKLGNDGIKFFLPKWIFFAFSVLLFITAQFLFIGGKLIPAIGLLGAIIITLVFVFRLKTPGVDVNINFGSGLKVLSMLSGLVLIAFGWFLLINQKITLQEWGVALTVPGCILAFLGLPQRLVSDNHEIASKSDILFEKSGFLNNYLIKALLIILSFVSIKIGYSIMTSPEYNMYSMLFYGLAIMFVFFSFPLINFAEKPVDNKYLDMVKLAFAVAAIFIAYLGQRDFVAGKVNAAIIKYIIAAAIFIIAFPVYSSKLGEEKEPFPIKIEVMFLIVIMIVGIFLRLYEIDLRPFGLENDEAGGYTYRLDAHGAPTVPLNVGNFGIAVHIVQFFSAIIGELNRTGIKMLGVSVGLISIPIMYFFIRSLLNPRSAIFATTIFTFLRWNLYYSRAGHGAVLSNAVEILAFFFLFKAIETRKSLIWFLAGLCVGLTWHGVMTEFLLIIPVVLYFVISSFAHKGFLKSNLIGIFAFLFGFWIFGSMIIHNFSMNKTIYFSRVAEVSVFSKDPNAPSKNPAKGIVENTKLVLLMFNHQGDSRQRNSGGNPFDPTIDFTSSIFYALGFLYVIYYSKYYMFFILAMAFFSQAAGSIFSIEAPSAMRAIGTMIPMFFLIAVIFDKIWLAFRKVFGKKMEFIYFPLILALFLVPIIKDNYYQYFGRWIGGLDELTTATGLYSKSLGNKWRVMLYTNLYYPGHPPFKINRSEKANTASRLTTALTYLKRVDTDNFALLFHYDTWQNLDSIKKHYFPESKLEIVDHKWFNKKLKPGEGLGGFAKAVLVTNEELKKKRGLTGNYSFGGGLFPNEDPEFKVQDSSMVPYVATWNGVFLAPYYGRFKFENNGTADFTLNIDYKNIPKGSDVLLAEGFHKIRITASRKKSSDTLSLNVRATGLTDTSFRGTEIIKLDSKYLYNFGIIGLHGYYINGNSFDQANKDSEIIDSNIQFDGAVYTTSAYWNGTINMPDSGQYFITASCNGYVRIVVDGNSYWEQSNGRSTEYAEKYFSNKPMKHVLSFNLSKGKHRITIYNLNSNIMHLMWNKGGQPSEPVPVDALEPDYDISKI